MIHVRSFERMVGDLGSISTEVDWVGATLAEIVADARRPEWGDAELWVAVDGVESGEADFGRVVSNNASVVVVPRLGGPFIPIGAKLTAAYVASLVGQAFAAVVVGLMLSSIVRVATRPRAARERGEQHSPTYAWDGIASGVGPGFRVPVVYGYHRVGGQIVSGEVALNAAPGSTNEDEDLLMVVVYSEGRCDSFGTDQSRVSGGPGGEAEGLGGLGNPGGALVSGRIPGGLKVNGNQVDDASAKVAIRLGEVGQRPMPDFMASATSTSVGTVLGEQVVSIVATEANRFRVRLTFAGGLYEASGSSTKTLKTKFSVEWRDQSSPGGAWTGIDEIVVEENKRERFTVEWERILPSGFGVYDVRVKLLAGQPQWTTNEKIGAHEAQLHSVITYVNGAYSYPRCALMGVQIRSNQLMNGSAADITVPMRGVRLPVWDSSLLLSEEKFWDVPDSSSAYTGIWTYPVGNNPAWVALDMLRSDYCPLAGEFQINAELLANIRDWADFCDQDTDDGTGTSTNHALCRFDYVFDSGTSPWDALLRVCLAGRASPVTEGNKISFVYDYRDAHGRGTNSVAARATGSTGAWTVNHTAIFTDSNTAVDVEMALRDTTERAKLLFVDILNEDLDWEHDTVPVEDGEAFADDPLYSINAPEQRKESIDLYGVTRAAQAHREGVLQHQLSKLVKGSITLTGGIEHLALEVGDVIGVQTDALRPFTNRSYGFRSTIGGTLTGATASGITIDHDYDASSGTHKMYVCETDNSVSVRTVTAGDYTAGDEIEFSGGSITITKATAVAIGVADQVLSDYIVVGISATEDLRRTVSAVEFKPDAFDVPAQQSLLSANSEATTGLGPSDDVSESVGVLVEADQNGTVVAWEGGDGYRSRASRVWVRADSARPWRMIGETTSTRLRADALEPHKAYEFAICTQDRDGGIFQAPEKAAPTTITVDEFDRVLPPTVTGLAAKTIPHGVQLEWHGVDSENFRDYEVRRNNGGWLGARIIGHPTEPTFVDTAPVYGTVSYLVRARNSRGLVSGNQASVSIDSGVPDGGVLHASSTDLSGSAAGTAVGLTFDATDDRLEMDALTYVGTYTSAELDAGSVAGYLWSVNVATDWVDDVTTVGELTGTVGDGEGNWTLVGGRPPSQHKRGHDFSTTVGELTGTVGDSNLLVSGRRGDIGDHVRFVVQARFDTTGAGSWTSYEPTHYFQTQRREAQKIQVKVTVHRASTDYKPRITSLIMAASF